MCSNWKDGLTLMRNDRFLKRISKYLKSEQKEITVINMMITLDFNTHSFIDNQEESILDIPVPAFGLNCVRKKNSRYDNYVLHWCFAVYD